MADCKEGAWWSKDTVAVVTGSNKGIGYGIVRGLAQHGLTVVLTARDPARGQAAVDALKAEGFQSVVFHPLEVSSPESVQALVTWLKEKFGGIDILVNNAGLNGNNVSYEHAKEIIETNYFGVRNVTEAVLPLLRASPAGARIVTVTSRRGQFQSLAGEELKQKFQNPDNYSTEFVDSMANKYLTDVKEGRAFEEGWVPEGKRPMYAESKIFCNAYSAGLAKSLSKSWPPGHEVFVTSFCPGFVQTDMVDRMLEGRKPPESLKLTTPDQGADTGVWLALLPKAELVEKNGKLFGERKEYSFSSIIFK